MIENARISKQGVFALLVACVVAVCCAMACWSTHAYADETEDLVAGTPGAEGSQEGEPTAESGQEDQPAIDIAAATVDAPSECKCTSRRIKPRVQVSYNGIALQKGVDYSVSYSNNKKPGTAKITITGLGSYTGTVVREFKIVGKYKPIVLVPDVSASSAGGIRRWLSRYGFKTVFTKTANVDIDDYDGLVLPGGDDVHPSFYGEKNKRARGCKKWLDRMQIDLVLKFADAEKPVLGICRGIQVINVAFGGSLIQNLRGGYHKGRRATIAKKGSWLYGALGRKCKTSHNHHQAVKRLGEGLVVTQRDAKRKIVEGIEHESLPIWGVQYHPEVMRSVGKKIAKKFRHECLVRVQ